MTRTIFFITAISQSALLDWLNILFITDILFGLRIVWKHMDLYLQSMCMV